MTSRRETAAGRCVIVLAAAALAPALAGAQPRFHLRPSMDVSERYEDNLFSTIDDRKSDLVSRVSPRISAGYRAIGNRFAFLSMANKWAT